MERWDKMKMYSAIEHLVHRKTGGKETREDNYIWHKNKEELIEKVEEHIKEFHQMETRFYDIIGYDIIEHEADKKEFEGEVNHHGSYEDFTVNVGECDIQDILYKKYNGVKVKITIEPIE